RQKAMIAKALAQETPYILLDEPTAFLDYPSKVSVMQILSQLAHERQKAILISTHDLDVALRYCDKVWWLTREEGSVSRLKEMKVSEFSLENL
ncbi:MAG: ABC transporter ATP-binding protein, partial [Oscillospiraceae bacterium]|nr:ABC transporter ATP-binding protein [Oscillospiraceae bacterium]